MTPSPTGTTVAVLGTGTMGAPIARNLAAAGFTVRAWNRSRAKADPLATDGVTVVDSPGAAAHGADFLITLLFDVDSVLSVAPEALGALPRDGVWLQMSTVGVQGTRRLARLAAEHRVAFVDAPVLGTKTPAEPGTLVVLASGEEALRARCAPVFAAVGERTLWVDGETGASTLKLVVNNWVLALIEGLAESIALAEGGGLDPQLFLDAIKGGPTDTPYAQLKGSMIIDRRFAPSFALSGATKDAGLVLDLAAEAGVDLAVTEAVRRHMARAVEMGHGDEDMAATYYAHRGN
ncbi:MAG: NAD(P)-dependent oxidoreductase [Actinomycetes bacterium]